MLPLQTNAPLDVLQVVPLWFPDFLFDHVRQYGVPNLFSRRGRGGKPSNCSGHSAYHGAGLILPERWLIGWRNSALAFTA